MHSTSVGPSVWILVVLHMNKVEDEERSEKLIFTLGAGGVQSLQGCYD